MSSIQKDATSKKSLEVRLACLADRLTEASDRETYAELIAFIRSLPPGDEMFRLVELLGLLSLLGQRVPVAVGELLIELREQAQTASSYHDKVDQRLASLPQEICASVDPAVIAKAMSESFRQQIVASGLQNTTASLKVSVAEVQTLAGQLAAALKPISTQYKGLGDGIAANLNKLTGASRDLQDHNAALIARTERDSLAWKGLLGIVLFLVGGLCGIWFRTGRTAEMLADMNGQIQRLQTPEMVAAANPAKVIAKRAKRQ